MIPYSFYNAFALALATLMVAGCGNGSQPPPKLGVKNWKPTGIGGPLEVRALPPAADVVSEWNKWLDSESAVKGRVYEAVLSSPSNQRGFKTEVKRSNTPLGWADHTYVRFLYTDPTNGTYEFLWYRLGKHDAQFLKLGEEPKTVWVRLNSVVNRE